MELHMIDILERDLKPLCILEEQAKMWNECIILVVLFVGYVHILLGVVENYHYMI